VCIVLGVRGEAGGDGGREVQDVEERALEILYIFVSCWGVLHGQFCVAYDHVSFGEK
jgi:hypothetical protein